MRDTRGVRASSHGTQRRRLRSPSTSCHCIRRDHVRLRLRHALASTTAARPLGLLFALQGTHACLTPMPLSPLVCYLVRHVASACAPGVRCFACEGPMLRNVHDSMSMPACQPPYFDRCYNIIRTWLRLVSRLWTYGVLHCT